MAVERLLTIATHSPVEQLTTIAKHIIHAGGKRLRPALTLLCAWATGEVNDRSILYAAVAELTHTASLLHDDVIDDAEMRRGKAAANRLWGNVATIMCGDYLLSQVFSMLAADGNISVLRTFAHASRCMCAGQLLELQHSYNVELSEEQYMHIIRMKTAELIATACRAGAISADSDEEMHQLFYNYGLSLGIAFQIVDDLLDLTGAIDTLGKPAGHDLREGKITLPLIRLIAVASDDVRKSIFEALRKRTINDEFITALREMIIEHGIDAYTRTVARKYAQQACDAIASLPTERREPLSEAATFVVNRQC